MRVVRVDDPDDPRLTDYRSLKDADLRRRVEASGPGRAGSFIAEGVTAIRRLLESAYPVRSVLVTPAKRQQLDDALETALGATDVAILEAEPAVVEHVVGFHLHRGAVAAADRLPMPAVADVLAAGSTVAVLEGLNDHENLGAIARSARGLGVAGLLLDPTCADPLYRRCVRVSMGEVLLLPWTRLAPWPAALDGLRTAGFRLLALTPSDDATPLDDVEVGQDDRVALLLGSEGAGLSDVSFALADLRVRVPLTDGVDSLNVGHAAAIAFHRFGRVAAPSRDRQAPHSHGPGSGQR